MNSKFSWPSVHPENDLRLGKMADALGCTAKLIQETWQMLGIDSFDDPHELSSVQEAEEAFEGDNAHERDCF